MEHCLHNAYYEYSRRNLIFWTNRLEIVDADKEIFILSFLSYVF